MPEDEWECGSCGAFIDAKIADAGYLYHDPDEDCRAIRVLEPEILNIGQRKEVDCE